MFQRNTVLHAALEDLAGLGGIAGHPERLIGRGFLIGSRRAAGYEKKYLLYHCMYSDIYRIYICC